MHNKKAQNNLPDNNISEPTQKLILDLIEDYFPPGEPKPNFEDIHFNLLSLLEISQKLLLEDEDILDRQTKNHIYNLLDIAKEIVGKRGEYELLDKLKEYVQLD